MIFGNASSILGSTIILATGQFDLLHCSLKNLRATAMTLNGSYLEKLMFDHAIYEYHSTWTHIYVFHLFIFNRELQRKHDFSSEEINQYYLAAECLDDIESNMEHVKMLKTQKKEKLPRRKYLPQDTYLMELTEELKKAFSDCIQHHQTLIAFSKMIDNFFSFFVLLKSFQISFLACNLTYMFIEVSSIVLLLFKN